MHDRRALWFVLIGASVWALLMALEASQFAAAGSRMIVAQLELTRDVRAFHVLLGRHERRPDGTLSEEDATGNEIWNADIARVNTAMDFVLIPLYWTAFVLLAQRGSPRWRGSVMLAITAAAAADVIENLVLLRALSAVMMHAAVTALPWIASTVKWELLAAAEALVAAAFAAPPARSRSLATVLTAAALSTAIGPFYLPSLSIAMPLLFAALAIAAYQSFPFQALTAPRIVALVQSAYLLRFQILAAVMLAVGLPIGRFMAPSIFAGMFDAIAFWSVMFIVWAACQLAWTVMITSRLTLAYGGDRFHGLQQFKPREDLSASYLVLFGALAAPCIVLTWFGTGVPAVAKSVATALGVLLAFGTLWLTAAVHFYIEPSPGHTARAVFPGFQFLQRRVQRGANDARSKSGAAIDRAVEVLLTPMLGTGLVRGSGAGGRARLGSGHQLAAAFLLLLIVLYGALGLALSPSWTPSAWRPAALFYFLFLLVLFTWAFSGLAFFLDALRLPVLTVAAVLSLLSGIARTDHEFAVIPAPYDPAPAAPEVVTAWEARRVGGDAAAPLVIVATAGGGIGAAAWTAQVLTGLADGCDMFARSLLLVSSVSGGSVGSMYVIGSYVGGTLPPAALTPIRDTAATSSLAAVGWGLAYPDLVRALPVLGPVAQALVKRLTTIDRGSALEAEWVDHWRARPLPATPTLRQWTDDVRAGARPAAIFNATASESGQPFLMGTTVIGRHPDIEGGSAFTIQFAHTFSTFDLPVPTAVRLSATFPWVSPMPRPNAGDESARVHLADGGYYDNSGMLSATQWLLDARPALGSHRVLLLLIDAASGVPNPGSAWSWQRQAVAPLNTLLTVRISSQQFRAAYEQEVITEYLAARDVDVTPVVLSYPADRLAPLSWHLTRDQRQRVAQAWSSPDATLRMAVKTVRDVFACPVM